MPTSRPERAVIDAARSLLLKRLMPLTEDPFEVELAEAITAFDEAEQEKKNKAKNRLSVDITSIIDKSFSQPSVIHQLMDDFRTSRSRKMPKNLELNIVETLKKFDEQALYSSASYYLDRHRGKKERYFYSIVRGRQEEKKDTKDPKTMYLG